MHLLKKIIIIAVIGAALYFLLGFHYVVIDNSVKMLKKSGYNMKYTFVSTKSRDLEKILTTRELWDDGIGDLLFEEGKISEEQLVMYQKKMEEDEESN